MNKVTAAEPNISLQVCFFFFKDYQKREVYLKINELKANLQSLMYIFALQKRHGSVCTCFHLTCTSAPNSKDKSKWNSLKVYSQSLMTTLEAIETPGCIVASEDY